MTSKLELINLLTESNDLLQESQLQADSLNEGYGAMFSRANNLTKEEIKFGILKLLEANSDKQLASVSDIEDYMKLCKTTPGATDLFYKLEKIKDTAVMYTYTSKDNPSRTLLDITYGIIENGKFKGCSVDTNKLYRKYIKPSKKQGKTQNESVAELLISAADSLNEQDEFNKVYYESNKLCSILETATYNFYNEVLTESKTMDKIKSGAKGLGIVLAKTIDKLIEFINTLVVKMQGIKNVFLLKEDMEPYKACFDISNIGSIIADLRNGKDVELDEERISKNTGDKINKLDLIKSLHYVKRALLDIKKLNPTPETNKTITYFNKLIGNIQSIINNCAKTDKKSSEIFEDEKDTKLREEIKNKLGL